MKTTKKVLSVLLVALMAFALCGVTVFADGEATAKITIKNNSSKTKTDATDYTWYKILVADIKSKTAVKEDDGTLNGDPGKVAYYVETQARATALEGTGLFTVTPAQTGGRWYVELADSSTSAEDIATALDGIKASFESGGFSMTSNGTAAAEVTPGYYLITSSLGTKLAVQTLADVTIKEKNEYPSLTIAIDKTTASIGEEVTYTVEVTIPATAAEKAIKVVDDIDAALTKDPAVTVTGAEGLESLTFNGNTVTIPASAVKANKGKTITLTYKATVNNDAVIDTALENTAHLEYDKYVSNDEEKVAVKTQGFTFRKIDGADAEGKSAEEKLALDALNGAKFTLWDAETGGNQIYVKLENGVYRVDISKDGATGDVIEAGEATIEGLADDKNYYLREDEAPTGYNRLKDRVKVTVSSATSAAGVDFAVENKSGVELPATGAMGTQIFYIVGILAILGAGVFMVTNKRIAKEEI